MKCIITDVNQQDKTAIVTMDDRKFRARLYEPKYGKDKDTTYLVDMRDILQILDLDPEYHKKWISIPRDTVRFETNTAKEPVQPKQDTDITLKNIGKYLDYDDLMLLNDLVKKAKIKLLTINTAL